MKISCFSTLAPGDTLTAQANFLADAGFDAMELVATPEDLARQMPEIQTIKTDLKIAVSAICALHRDWLIDPDADARQAALVDIGTLLELSGEIGECGVFVIPILGYTHAYPGAPVTGRTRQEDRDLLTEQLAALSRIAEQAGTMLWLEVINRYESPVANTIAESAAIVRDIGSSQCALNVDFFHMNIEEANLLEALRRNGRHVGHVHAGDSTRNYPGFGHLDYPKLIRVLAESGYQNYLTVDAGDRSIDPAVVLPEIASYLRGLVGLVTAQVVIPRGQE